MITTKEIAEEGNQSISIIKKKKPSNNKGSQHQRTTVMTYTADKKQLTNWKEEALT